MSILLHSTLFLLIIISTNAQTEPRKAAASLMPRYPHESYYVSGTIEFTETDNGVRITGILTGMPPGSYGFHVHEAGDISTCDAAGAHFNPDDTTHGGKDHEERHVGDLGNIVFSFSNGASVANVDITDSVLTLKGRNSVLGRTLVLHEEEDDLGLGGYELSATTGNAGARVACGVIGIVSPVEPWE